MQRHGSGGNAALLIRAAGLVLLVAHLLLVGWLTLRPLSVPWVTAPNLQPLVTIRADLALSPWEALRGIGSELLLLAPLGVLLPLAGGRLYVSRLASMVRTVAAGAMVSFAIELLQTGVPGQVVDVDSLLLNTAGVWLAHLAVVPAARTFLRRRTYVTRPGLSRRADLSQGVTPTISRVGIAP